MAVRVEGDRDARVPEHLRNDLGVYALREKEGGARVPEVVETAVEQIGPLE